MTTSATYDADWQVEEAGGRRYYVVRSYLDGQCVALAHGWVEQGDRLVLEKIEVEEGYRSRGHGTALLGFIRARARVEGCQTVVIKGVRDANERAIKLYESLGAVCTERFGDLCSFVISPP